MMLMLSPLIQEQGVAHGILNLINISHPPNTRALHLLSLLSTRLLNTTAPGKYQERD